MTNADNVGGLLPCPFCGGAPKVESSFGSWSVSCICGVTGPRVGKGMDYDEERTMVIAVWNQRAELCRAAPAGGDYPNEADGLALELVSVTEERDFLRRRVAELSAPAGSGEVEEMAKRLLVEASDVVENTCLHDVLMRAAALLRKLQQGTE